MKDNLEILKKLLEENVIDFEVIEEQGKPKLVIPNPSRGINVVIQFDDKKQLIGFTARFPGD